MLNDCSSGMYSYDLIEVDLLTGVHFSAVTEYEILFRLYRMLSKKKFEEAVMFAKMYHLEIDVCLWLFIFNIYKQ